MVDFESKKIVNRFAEATGQKFVKIPNEVIQSQKLVILLEDELQIEKSKVTKDKFTIDLLEAKWIAQRRHLSEQRKKFKV